LSPITSTLLDCLNEEEEEEEEEEVGGGMKLSA